MAEIIKSIYRGFRKDDILKIQRDNMPQYSVPSFHDVDITNCDFKSQLDDAVSQIAKREAWNSDICVICEMALLYLDMLSDNTLKGQIIAKAESIADLLSKGKSIEIHPCKDGIKIMEVSKKILKNERVEP